MNNLKNLRMQIGLTQETFAKKLGISRDTYKNYEQHRTEMGYDMLIRTATICNCSIDYLLEHQTKNAVYLDGLTESQKMLFEDIKDLSEENCQRVQDFIFGISIAETKKQEVQRKFNSHGG